MQGFGIIPVEPPITGTWPFEGFPTEVQLNGRTFAAAVWASPFYGAVAQYREEVDQNAQHLLVYRDGSYEITHVDEANPDRGYVLQHAALDCPSGLAIGAAIGGVFVGLVTGLLLFE